MKAELIAVICVYVALLPSIKSAPSSNESYESDEDESYESSESDEDGPFQEYINELSDMAKRGEIINDVFKISDTDCLGLGSFGFTFKGTLRINSSDEVMVAMKFTPIEDEVSQENQEKYARKEYEMYTYLGAINNSNVEAYGIPSVYYYGQWNDCYLIAITLLDKKSDEIRGPNGINPVDALIVFREFVRITKYMHSRGVCHGDITLDNVMFRQHQGFIIDLNMAIKMRTDVPGAAKQYAKEDSARFLTSMCRFFGIQFGFAPDGVFSENVFRSNIMETMEALESIEHGGLKRVFVEFAKHVFQDEIASSQNRTGETRYAVSETKSFYDQLYTIITDEIGIYSNENPAIVSWLTGPERKKAMKSLKKHPIPEISSINDPFGMIEFKYPEVNFDYFSKHLSVAGSSSKKMKTKY